MKYMVFATGIVSVPVLSFGASSQLHGTVCFFPVGKVHFKHCLTKLMRKCGQCYPWRWWLMAERHGSGSTMTVLLIFEDSRGKDGEREFWGVSFPHFLYTKIRMGWINKPAAIKQAQLPQTEGFVFKCHCSLCAWRKSTQEGTLSVNLWCCFQAELLVHLRDSLTRKLCVLWNFTLPLCPGSIEFLSY